MLQDLQVPRCISTSQLFTPPSSSVHGTVSVTVSDTPSGLNVSLGGHGDGWSTTSTTLTLAPMSTQTLPVWYALKMETITEGFSLTGVQIFSSEGSTMYFPASSGVVLLNLLNNLPQESTAANYILAVGIVENSTQTVTWVDDPTISFDPQG